MKILKKLIAIPVLGAVIKYFMLKKVQTEASRMATHFSSFMLPKLATSKKEINDSFALRHGVYCEELNFEAVRDNGLENDAFDAHALHCLIEHKSTNKYVGTIRVVCSSDSSELLPLEKYCLDSIDHPNLHPANFPREKICEISRLAVPKEFRRRRADQHEGAATGVINETAYSETELRCFPFIAVGLYLSAASITLNKGIDHCFVMMEPRLARSMKFIGIEFTRIGPVVEYHGKRAPYHIDPRTLVETLSPGFIKLLSNITEQLGTCWSPEGESERFETALSS